MNREVCHAHAKQNCIECDPQQEGQDLEHGALEQLAALMQSLEIPPSAAHLSPVQLSMIGAAICKQAKDTTISPSLKQLVDEQANDEGLWCQTKYASEAYLQTALRQLHAAIEGISPEDCALAVLAGEQKD